MEIVVNRDYGGFGISDEAYEKLIEWGVPVVDKDAEGCGQNEMIFRHSDEYVEKFGTLTGRYFDDFLNKDRTNPLLIKVIKELGDKANDRFASLEIVEIPDGIEYTIDEYDGWEKIHEAHRSW